MKTEIMVLDQASNRNLNKGEEEKGERRADSISRTQEVCNADGGRCGDGHRCHEAKCADVESLSIKNKRGQKFRIVTSGLPAEFAKSNAYW
jgi:hypothetical protein